MRSRCSILCLFQPCIKPVQTFICSIIQPGRIFSRSLLPICIILSPDVLSNQLLSNCYSQQHMHMGKESQSTAVGMDDASIVLSRSMSNIIAHGLHSWFVEYLRVDSKSKSASELRIKVRSVLDQIASFFGSNIADAFISNTCNAMLALRNQLMDNRDVDYAYEYVAHSLNNLSKDLINCRTSNHYSRWHSSSRSASRIRDS